MSRPQRRVRQGNEQVFLSLRAVLMIGLAIFAFLMALGVPAFSTFIQNSKLRSAAEVFHAGVQMARDPVCGTFVVPDGTLSVSVGRERMYFCSPACRDKYRAKTA